MKYLGRFMAILVALLFISLLPCGIWAVSAGQLARDVDTYKYALNRDELYTDLVPSVLPEIVKEAQIAAEQEGQETFVLAMGQYLTEDDWYTIAEQLTPPDWFYRELNTNIDALFAWANNETDIPYIAIDTTPIKEGLSGQNGVEIVNIILRSWPECTPEQVQQQMQYLDANNGDYPICRPPANQAREIRNYIADMFQQFADEIPETVPPSNWLYRDDVRVGLNSFKQVIGLTEIIVAEVWLLSAALLALIVFFTVRGLRSFLRWTGGTILLGGIFAIIPIPFLISSIIPAVMFGEGAEPTYSDLIFADMVRVAVGELTMPVLVMSALGIGLGFIFLVLSAIVSSPEEHIEKAKASILMSMHTPTPMPAATMGLGGSHGMSQPASPTPHPSGTRADIQVEDTLPPGSEDPLG